jgi:hypothetical protein
MMSRFQQENAQVDSELGSTVVRIREERVDHARG